MKNYTKIPNEIFEHSQVSGRARLLLCVLLKYCGQKETCYPSQETLGRDVGFSARYVRESLGELTRNGLVRKKRTGFNRPNTYTVAKSFVLERNLGSYHLGSKFPLEGGSTVPDKSTYIKGKDKKNLKILDKMRADLTRRRSMDKS